jgi:hypothetical protein
MIKVLLIVLVAFATLGVAQERRPVADTITGVRVESTVYITRKGTKYHRESCSFLNRSKMAITLKEAEANRYEPCKRCYRNALENKDSVIQNR